MNQSNLDELQNDDFFELAIEFPTHNIFQIFSNFCKSNNMVMPISFFEKYQGKYFNSLVVIDADGSLSDIYRKSKELLDIGIKGEDFRMKFVKYQKFNDVKLI